MDVMRHVHYAIMVLIFIFPYPTVFVGIIRGMIELPNVMKFAAHEITCFGDRILVSTVRIQSMMKSNCPVISNYFPFPVPYSTLITLNKHNLG